MYTQLFSLRFLKIHDIRRGARRKTIGGMSMLDKIIKPTAVALALGIVSQANPAAAYTWLPKGVYTATGTETTASPGVGPQSCEAFWYLEVTDAGKLKVLAPGAPRCQVTAYGLPWRVEITGPTTAVIHNVWFQGMALKFCQGNVRLTLKPGGVLEFVNAPMAAGCAFSGAVTTSKSLQIAE
jgi:hypothetical protein